MKNYIFLMCFVFSCLYKSNAQSNLISVKIGEYWGYADRNGQMIINPTFQEAYGFSDGLALVKSRYAKNYESNGYGYINVKGTFVIPPKYCLFVTSSFVNGYAVVSKVRSHITMTDEKDPHYNRVTSIIDKKEK